MTHHVKLLYASRAPVDLTLDSTYSVLLCAIPHAPTPSRERRALNFFNRRLLFLCVLFGCWACSDPINNTSGDSTPDVDMNNADARVDASMVCVPGAVRCRDTATKLVCNAQGSAEQTLACGAGERCVESSGTCAAEVCAPGAFDACTPEGNQRYCNPQGTEFVEEPCPGGAPCTNGACSAPECSAGVRRCLGPEQVQLCNEARAWVPGEFCPTGTECFDGKCELLCELNKKVSSYIGCEYWSVDLDNYDDALSQPHAIVITNPNPTLPATVTLMAGYSDVQLRTGADGLPFDLTIPPKEFRIYSVPVGFDHSGTRMLQDKAIRVSSSIPVIAHQFNPLNNVDVYSNDGTLLIPTNSTGKEYWGMSWPHRGGRARIRGFLTIVNSTGAPNKVRVTPSAQVVAGEGIPVMNAGIERIFELAPGASLNLETSGIEFDDALVSGCLEATQGTPPNMSPCPDLTGTHIKADQPITVFGGHQCGNVVFGVDRCDHLESILFPVQSWGKDYVGTKFSPRSTSSVPEPDIWRVMASEDNTLIRTDPPIDGINGFTLQAGEWRQFEATEDFRLGSNRPIMLAQYMVGANWLGIPRVCNMGADAASPVGIGDPAMALAVPASQYRKDYFVLAPDAYEQDFLNLIAPANASIIMDGQAIDESLFRAVGTGAYKVAIVPVQDGFHTLTSSVAFGVVSYGYDCRVSYASAGGLNLTSNAQ